MATYSFLDVNCTIVGPGGAISLGAGHAVANEGISADFVGNRNTMTAGAGKSVMHSLHAATPGTMTVRLMKTSSQNFLLGVMFDLQSTSSALWGINTLVVSDVARGDIVTGMQAAFQKMPNNVWATEGNILEWIFECGQMYELLGKGSNLS